MGSTCLLVIACGGHTDSATDTNRDNGGRGATTNVGGNPSGSSPATGAAGMTPSGGSNGGEPSTGGAGETTGGRSDMGGRLAAGGSPPTGGAPDSGGVPSSGGRTSSGGESTTGAASHSAGASSTGGLVANGGEPSTGGFSPNGGGLTAGGASTGGTTGDLPRFVGNTTTGRSSDLDVDGLIYSDYWDQLTPENAGKWTSIQASTGGEYNWKTLDTIYDYAEDNGLIFKEHTFIWGTAQLAGVESEDVIDWFRSFCERYPNTALIDVVNEPPPHTTPSYANAIGGGTNGDWQWITNAFLWARQYCPKAILILNDYSNIEWSDSNQHFIDIVNTVLANGGPIDALGAQAHDLDHADVSMETVSDLLNKLHEDTGLPVYITEMDMSYADDQEQLSAYQEYFPLFRDTDFVKGITIWGWIYGSTWSLAQDSGLVREGVARPAMTYLMDLLQRPAP